MAVRMATRRAASFSSTFVGRIFSRNTHLSSVAPPSRSRFIRYYSDGKHCTITAYGSFSKRSDKFAINPGICDPHMQNPFQTLGPKGAYEVKQIQEGLFVRMEMPGIDRNDVKILVDNEDSVYVKGQGKKESTHEQNGRAYNFRVKIPPYHSMIHQNIEAELKNGVLRIMIPMAIRKIEAEVQNSVREIVTPNCKTIQVGGKGDAIHDECDDVTRHKTAMSSHDIETQKKESDINTGTAIPNPTTSEEIDVGFIIGVIAMYRLLAHCVAMILCCIIEFLSS